MPASGSDSAAAAIFGDGSFYPGEFNGSAQHLLILLDGELSHADVTDIIHLEAEDRTVGAVEERTKRVGHLPGAGKEEQDRRPAEWLSMEAWRRRHVAELWRR